jgi:hypothetical protein
MCGARPWARAPPGVYRVERQYANWAIHDRQAPGRRFGAMRLGRSLQDYHPLCSVDIYDPRIPPPRPQRGKERLRQVLWD